MTALWICVVAMLVAALMFLVPSLLRTSSPSAVRPHLAPRLYADQLAQLDKDLASNALNAQDHAQAIEDLQRQALDEQAQATPAQTRLPRPWMAWGIAGVLSIGMPAAALLLYLQVGDPGAVATQVLAAQRAGTHESDGADMESMVSRLAMRLQSKPDDVEGWIVLARSYEVLQRYDDAVVAYQRAMALAPGQPQLLVDYADALASARDGDLDGPAQEAIDSALAIDPNHPKALALAGMAAFKRGDIPQARKQWEHVLTLLPPDSEGAQNITANLAHIDSQNKAAPATPVGPTAPSAVTAQKNVEGTVSISDALRDKVAPQDTVFVLARAAAIGRMPVAILRLQVKDLPAKFILDDKLAMSPEAKISRFDKVTVEVRVSRSGQAAAQSGDLFGRLADVAMGQQGLTLQADQMQR